MHFYNMKMILDDLSFSIYFFKRLAQCLIVFFRSSFYTQEKSGTEGKSLGQIRIILCSFYKTEDYNLLILYYYEENEFKKVKPILCSPISKFYTKDFSHFLIFNFISKTDDLCNDLPKHTKDLQRLSLDFLPSSYLLMFPFHDSSLMVRLPVKRMKIKQQRKKSDLINKRLQ